ncbi:MAG TPA: ZPR1 zinc finger domain-containing protein [Methanobacterium sp.]|nr:ZPR1 zinc finger domain-containing protein [Methanobacterium sp.]
MKGDCPVCESKGTVELISKTEEIPYFGEIMESTIICSQCGYKHSDTICLEQKEPVRYSITIKKDNLNARVVKSQTATVSIPELGLQVEPGTKCQGYVSNIEGILNRFEDAVKTALNFVEEDESKSNALKILEEIKKVKNGEREVEIIIEDPFGHSIIIHEDANKRELTLEEIKNLETGFITFENE